MAAQAKGIVPSLSERRVEVPVEMGGVRVSMVHCAAYWVSRYDVCDGARMRLLGSWTGWSKETMADVKL